jgi:hypothetical protein
MPFKTELMRPVLGGLVVVVMAVVTMVVSGSKSRARKDENKQNSSENLLHGPNVAWRLLWKQAPNQVRNEASRKDTSSARGVN